MKSHIRNLWILLVAVMAIITFTACSNNNDQEKSADSSKNAGTTELEEQVVVYSTHSEDLIEIVADAFQEKTGVKVEYINLKGELNFPGQLG